MMTDLFEKPSDLSEFLFRITTNGGRSADRYTVVFSDGDYLGMSGSPSHPQGVSMWGEGIDPAVQSEAVENGLEVDLALGDLPEGLVSHILGRCNEGFRDFLELVEAKDPSHVARDRASAPTNEGISTSLGVGIYLEGDAYKVKTDSPEDDRGPYHTAREAVLATLPDQYGFAGPEYHSSLEVGRLEPDETVLAAVAALESKVDDEYAAAVSPGLGR